MSSITIDFLNEKYQDYNLVNSLKKAILKIKKQSTNILSKTVDFAKQQRDIKEEKKLLKMIREINKELDSLYEKIGEDIKIYTSSDFEAIQKKLEEIMEEVIRFSQSSKKNIKTKLYQQKTEKLLSKEKHKYKTNQQLEKELKLISKIKGIPIETLKKLPIENLNNLREEVKLIIEKHKEEELLQPKFKLFLNFYRDLVNDISIKNDIDKILNKHITKEDFQAVKQKVIKKVEEETKQKFQERTKESLINGLLEKGYIIEKDEEQILYIDTPEKDYKIMIKVSNSKITSRFIKIIDSENYQPTEYEKIKDKEKMLKWCKDFKNIKEKLRKKGIFIEEKTNVYEMQEGINYVVSKDKKIKQEEKNLKYMEKK